MAPAGRHAGQVGAPAHAAARQPPLSTLGHRLGIRDDGSRPDPERLRRRIDVGHHRPGGRGQAETARRLGALAAWAWGLSRAIDYFETDKAVDAKQLGVEGHSRYGKAALLAAALDERWAIAYPSCSGEGGAKLSRRNWGETVDNIASSHWMAANFRKYAGHWGDLPVDSHELIALVAPRPVFLNGGTQDQWADPHGAVSGGGRRRAGLSPPGQEGPGRDGDALARHGACLRRVGLPLPCRRPHRCD